MVLTPETLREINDHLQTLIEICVTGFIPVAGVLLRLGWKLARAWADAKIAGIQNEELRKELEFAFTRLDQTAETVVREIEQTLVKRGEDGRVVDPAKLAMAAVKRTKDRLPKMAVDTFTKNYTEDDWIRLIKGKVESKVKFSVRC